METRRIKARNGEGLTFSVVGEGPGRSAISMSCSTKKPRSRRSSSARERRQGVRLVAALRQRICGSRMGAGLRRANRDEILVSTKIGRIMDPFTKPPKPRSDVVSPGFAGGHPHAPRFDYSYDGAMRSIEHSLLRTGLDRLDIVLIHDCDPWTHGDAEAPLRFKEAKDGGPAIARSTSCATTKPVKAIGFGINDVCSLRKIRSRPAISTWR